MSKNKEAVDSALKKKKLTLKQKKFTTEYLKTGNGTQSAIKAGYSKNCAQQIATENLTKPLIRSTIESEALKLGIDIEYVLGNFKDLAEFGKTKVLKAKNINGELVNELELADGHLAHKSTESLARALKLFVDKVEIDAKVETKTDEDTRKQIARKLLLALQNPEILGDLADF
jgi:phage terminase small subunit